MQEAVLIQTTATVESRPNLPANSRELIGLLHNDSFQKGFVDVQTQPQKEAKDTVQGKIKERVKVSVNAEIDLKAAQRLGTTIEEGKTKGKEWGEAVRAVKSEVVRTEEQADGTKKDVRFWEEVNARVQKQEEESPAYLEELAQANRRVLQAEVDQRMVLAQLTQEAEARAEDPALLAAYEVWGRSPNAQGDFGTDNNGYNAGITHFFEYRSKADKNGRYKNSKTPVTIDGFIDYSNRLKQLLQNIDPGQNPDIKASALLKDAKGQIRLHMVTSAKYRIVAFRRANETGFPRIITIFPGQDEQSIAKAVQEEKSGKSKVRLNQLGEGIEDVPITEYPKIITHETTPGA